MDVEQEAAPLPADGAVQRGFGLSVTAVCSSPVNHLSITCHHGPLVFSSQQSWTLSVPDVLASEAASLLKLVPRSSELIQTLTVFSC